MGEIVVLGSANVDFVVRQPRLARPGETIFGSSFSTVAGGKGLNQAIAAARAEGDVAFIGAVGADAFGRQLRDALIADHIDVDGIVLSDAPTGTAHIAVTDDGENSIVVVPGANGAVQSLTTDDTVSIASGTYLVTQLERPLPLVVDALQVARHAHVRTVLTPAPVQKLGEDVLSLVDYLFANAAECCALAGVDDERAAARDLSRLVGTVVMTRGSRGALVAEGGEITLEVPARRVVPVDTTAAGDTFAGVAVARLARGDALDEALRAATAAASIAVTRAGASVSMPAWAEISALL